MSISISNTSFNGWWPRASLLNCYFEPYSALYERCLSYADGLRWSARSPNRSVQLRGASLMVGSECRQYHINRLLLLLWLWLILHSPSPRIGSPFWPFFRGIHCVTGASVGRPRNLSIRADCHTFGTDPSGYVDGLPHALSAPSSRGVAGARLLAMINSSSSHI